MRRDGGFSMIELLVAVLVLSIATLGAFRAFGSGSATAAATRDRALAGIVALNRVAELDLGVAPPDGPVALGGQVWEVTTGREATRAGFARVEVRVARVGVRRVAWLDPGPGG